MWTDINLKPALCFWATDNGFEAEKYPNKTTEHTGSGKTGCYTKGLTF